MVHKAVGRYLGDNANPSIGRERRIRLTYYRSWVDRHSICRCLLRTSSDIGAAELLDLCSIRGAIEQVVQIIPNALWLISYSLRLRHENPGVTRT